MKELRTQLIVSDEIYYGLDKSERELLKNSSKPNLMKQTRKLQGELAMLSGLFKIFDVPVSLYFFKSYFPTALARRSFLYLQTLLDVNFGVTYFTTRSGLKSFILLQTVSGTGSLLYQGEAYELHSNDVFLIDCRKLHDYRTVSTQGWHYRLAHFDGNAMTDIFEQILLNQSVKFHFDGDTNFTNLFKKLFEINRKTSTGDVFITNSLLHQLMTELLITLPQFNEDNLPVQIREIRDFLEKNCCEYLSLDSLAEHFRISKYHMCRIYKKYTGKTILNSIVEERLKKAKEFLRYTDCSIEDITENISYENVSHFSRLFRQNEGITPSAYRKMWKGL